MTWVAVAIAGSAVIGGVSSQMAADKQAAGGDKAINANMASSEQARHDLNPWAQYGGWAQSDLINQSGVGSNGQFDPNSPLMKPFSLQDFQQSPSYQFNLQQGQQAIDKAANARGMFYAPQTLQDVSKFSQGVAGNEFNNAYNMYNQNQSNQFGRLFALSGAGQNAAAHQGGYSMSAGQNIGGIQQGIGNVQGAGIMGAGNAAQGGLQNYIDLLMQNQARERANKSLYSSGGPVGGGGDNNYGQRG